jgi:hypothetical protein
MRPSSRGARFAATLAALAFLVACHDAKQSATPTEPTAADTAATSALTAGPPNLSVSPNSSLCQGYQKERDDAKAALARSPQDADQQAAVAAYDAVIADACQ